MPKPLLELIESTLGRRPNGSPRTISEDAFTSASAGATIIKTNTLDHPNFACEADGLTAIAKLEPSELPKSSRPATPRPTPF